MNIDEFIGREPEVRTIASNIEAGHATLVIGEEGVGKTALLEVIHLLIIDRPLIYLYRAGSSFWLFPA